jgi:hypothetical protein
VSVRRLDGEVSGSGDKTGTDSGLTKDAARLVFDFERFHILVGGA